MRSSPEPGIDPVQRALGRLGAALARLWLRLFGRTVERRMVPWLDGTKTMNPSIGEVVVIRTSFPDSFRAALVEVLAMATEEAVNDPEFIEHLRHR